MLAILFLARASATAEYERTPEAHRHITQISIKIGKEAETIPNEYEINGPKTLDVEESESDVRTWPENTVRYKWGGKFEEDKQLQMKVRAVMDELELGVNKCIIFTEDKTGEDAISITDAPGCTSVLGYQNKPATVGLNVPSCMWDGIIAHELLHVLGLGHEHNSPMRDHFVKVQNVRKDARSFFAKSTGPVFDVPYNFDSVMHFGKDWYPKTKGHTTLEPKVLPGEKTPRTLIAQRFGPAATDYNKILELYQCPGRFIGRETEDGCACRQWWKYHQDQTNDFCVLSADKISWCLKLNPFCGDSNWGYCVPLLSGHKSGFNKESPCRCPHGLRVDEATCHGADGIHCAFCETGYFLNGLECTKSICECRNGTPQGGIDCHTHGEKKCQACYEGFDLSEDGKSCISTECTCENGVPLDPMSCPANGRELCFSCNPGATLVDNTCKQTCAGFWLKEENNPTMVEGAAHETCINKRSMETLCENQKSQECSFEACCVAGSCANVNCQNQGWVPIPGTSEILCLETSCSAAECCVRTCQGFKCRLAHETPNPAKLHLVLDPVDDPDEFCCFSDNCGRFLRENVGACEDKPLHHPGKLCDGVPCTTETCCKDGQPCGCKNGEPVPGHVCKPGEEYCLSCMDGFFLRNGACEQKVCTCEGGRSTVGTSCRRNGMEFCLSCFEPEYRFSADFSRCEKVFLLPPQTEEGCVCRKSYQLEYNFSTFDVVNYCTDIVDKQKWCFKDDVNCGDANVWGYCVFTCAQWFYTNPYVCGKNALRPRSGDTKCEVILSDGKTRIPVLCGKVHCCEEESIEEAMEDVNEEASQKIEEIAEKLALPMFPKPLDNTSKADGPLSGEATQSLYKSLAEMTLRLEQLEQKLGHLSPVKTVEGTGKHETTLHLPDPAFKFAPNEEGEQHSIFRDISVPEASLWLASLEKAKLSKEDQAVVGQVQSALKAGTPAPPDKEWNALALQLLTVYRTEMFSQKINKPVSKQKQPAAPAPPMTTRAQAEEWVKKLEALNLTSKLEKDIIKNAKDILKSNKPEGSKEFEDGISTLQDLSIEKGLTEKQNGALSPFYIVALALVAAAIFLTVASFLKGLHHKNDVILGKGALVDIEVE